VSEKSTIATAVRYGLSRWDGLVRFLDEAERELFVRKSNSLVVCMRLSAEDRGGICLGKFDWWSLTPDWGKIDEQVRHLVAAKLVRKNAATRTGDGRIEMDTNSVERTMRPIALNRKNSLFAGHDEGAVNWACLASLIETAKLNGIDPQAYLADILAKLVNGWPVQKLDELLPWAWAKQQAAYTLAA
jgi:hypothetical protein